MSETIQVQIAKIYMIDHRGRRFLDLGDVLRGLAETANELRRQGEPGHAETIDAIVSALAQLAGRT